MILPATMVASLVDEPLLVTLNVALQRERRFPLSLMLALRPAFKRMKLHVFKAGKGETFVTAIPPKPLDADHAIDAIRDMHALLLEHPGWTRGQLAAKLRPGCAPDSPEVTEFLQPLAWLIDKGHVIEFYNGALAVPGAHKIDVHAQKTGEESDLNRPPPPSETAPASTDGEPASAAETSAVSGEAVKVKEGDGGQQDVATQSHEGIPKAAPEDAPVTDSPASSEPRPPAPPAPPAPGS
jgi:hypothetical protein